MQSSDTQRLLRITAGLLIGAGFVIVLASGIRFVRLKAENRVDAILAKLAEHPAYPVKVGKWRLGLFDLEFEDITIGREDTVVVSKATVSLAPQPLSKEKVRIDSVHVDQLRLTSKTDNLIDIVNALTNDSTHSSTFDTKPDGDIDLLMNRLPIGDRLIIRNGGASLLDAYGRTLYRLRGIAVMINKKQKRVVARVTRIEDSTGEIDNNIECQLALQHDSKVPQYRFFAGHIKGSDISQSRSHSWTVSGSVAPNLTDLKLHGKFSEVPKVLQRLLSQWLTDMHGTSGEFNLQAERKKSLWNFETVVRAKGIKIGMPFVSSESVGPFPVTIRATGSLDQDSHTVKIDQGLITTRPKASEHQKLSPFKLSFRGGSRPARDPLQGQELYGEVQVPEQSCQHLVSSVPPGFAPKLGGFKLSGTMGGTLEFVMPLKAMDETHHQAKDITFGCEVIHAPEAYSADRLRGPFTLEKEMSKQTGSVTVRVSPESRSFTPFEAIAKAAGLAFVTSEDATFWSHKGIDSSALDSAFRRNVTEGRVALGGSTITMQTVKNLFLTHERTLSRKYQEMILAWYLERILDKERIFEIYVNIIEFGPGIYGITDASDHYFNKHPFDLTLKESAFLAALLPSPVKRYRHFCTGETTAEFKSVMDGLLRRMLGLGRINYNTYARALQGHLDFNERSRIASPVCAAVEEQGKSG